MPHAIREKILMPFAEKRIPVIDPYPFVGTVAVERLGEAAPSGIAENRQMLIAISGTVSDKSKAVAPQDVVADRVKPYYQDALHETTSAKHLSNCPAISAHE